MNNFKIVEGKGCYSSKFNIDTTSNCIGNCLYCYGGYLNKKQIVTKVFNQKSLDRQYSKLKIKDYPIIRIGKFTDPGYEKVQFTMLIDWMYSKKISPVIVTKMPHGDEDIYRKVTELKGVYQITLGYDNLEPGICSNDFTNDYRKMVGDSFIDKGYNVIWRLVREVTGPADVFTKNIISGYPGRVLLTPLRLKGKPMIQQLGGDVSKYKYYKNFYRPIMVHNDYKGLKGCLDSGKLHMCGKCLLN